MPSAALPPELHQIAREAARNGSRAGAAAHGHDPRARPLPADRGRPERPRSPSASASTTPGSSSAPASTSRRRAAAERAPDRPRRRSPAARALQDAGVDPLDLDLVLVATMSADEITPERRAARRPRARRRARRRVRHRRRLHRLPRRRCAQAAALIETGRAERVLVIGAEMLTRITDFDDQKTGDAVRRRRRRRRARRRRRPARHRPDRAAPPTAASATRSSPRPRTACIRMDGHSTFKIAVKRLSESTVAAVARAGLELDDIDLFVYHQANGAHPQGRRRAARPRARAKVADYIAQLGNTSRRLDPAHALAAARGRPPAARPEGAARRDRRGLHLGRRRRWSGAIA